jgi:hypothetical protein
MENMGDWEQKNLLPELTQGRELARQLQTYDKAISMLQRSSSVGEPQHSGGAVSGVSESRPSLAGGPRIEDSDPENPDDPQKR